LLRVYVVRCGPVTAALRAMDTPVPRHSPCSGLG
jgi:hypothetical protein